MAASAPTYRLPLPLTALRSVEFPGPVGPLPSSQLKALTRLGTLPVLLSILHQPSTAAVPELDLSGGKGGGRGKIKGETQPVQNVLMRVVKRTRTREMRDHDGTVHPIGSGVYTLEPIGLIDQTVRFRAMADFQFVVQEPEQDSVLSLAKSVKAMDAEAIIKFRFEEPNEVFDEVKLIPPPVFSRIDAPQIYEYRPSPSATQEIVEGPNGTTTTRLKSASAFKGYSPRSITFASTDPVPSSPPPKLAKDRETLLGDALSPVEIRMLAILVERPVWTRAGILNLLEVDQARVVINAKQSIPMVSYTFSDGPFRDLIIRFSYDPRTDYRARMYQHLTLRNADNARVGSGAVGNLPIPASTPTTAGTKGKKGKGKQKEVVEMDPESMTNSIDKRRTHIFDGQTLHSKVGNYQLIDILDPLLLPLIQNSKMYILPTDSPTLEEGWWRGELFEIFRKCLKRRFTALAIGRVEEGGCEDLIGELGRRMRDGEGGGRRQAQSEEEEEEEAEATASEEEEGEEGATPNRSRRSTTTTTRSTRSTPLPSFIELTKAKGRKPKKVLLPSASGIAGKNQGPTRNLGGRKKTKNAPMPMKESEEIRAAKLRAAIGLGSMPLISSQFESGEERMDDSGRSERSWEEDEEEEAVETSEEEESE